MRTLQDDDTRSDRRTALVAKFLDKYDLYFATVTGNRLSDEGSPNESGQSYSIFWRGVPDGLPCIHGVDIVIKNSIITSLVELPVSYDDRFMSIRILLARSNYTTVIRAYGPTLVTTDEAIDEFYGSLPSVLLSTERLMHSQKSIWFSRLSNQNCENIWVISTTRIFPEIFRFQFVHAYIFFIPSYIMWRKLFLFQRKFSILLLQ